MLYALHNNLEELVEFNWNSPLH